MKRIADYANEVTLESNVPQALLGAATEYDPVMTTPET